MIVNFTIKNTYCNTKVKKKDSVLHSASNESRATHCRIQIGRKAQTQTQIN